MVSPALGYALWRIFFSGQRQRHQPFLQRAGLQTCSLGARHKASLKLCSFRNCHRVRTVANIKKNPFQWAELRERIGGTSVRCLASAQRPLLRKPSDIGLEEMKNEKWLPVYRFKGVLKYVFVSRLKMLQTAASILFVPYSYYQLLNGQIDSDTFNVIVSASVFATIMLYIFSRSFSRVIGVVSINSERNIVRIGHINFFGGRNDVCTYVEDVVPLTESSEPWGAFVKLNRYSNGQGYLLLSTKEVEITNEEFFEHIFGVSSQFIPAQSTNQPKHEENEKQECP